MEGGGGGDGGGGGGGGEEEEAGWWVSWGRVMGWDMRTWLLALLSLFHVVMWWIDEIGGGHGLQVRVRCGWELGHQ